jgi:hypothetical protein
MPMQRASGNFASISGVGVVRNKAVSTPADAIASIASVEPVKSSL